MPAKFNVFCRITPNPPKENSTKLPNTIRKSANNKIFVEGDKEYQFTQVFDSKSTQKNIFDQIQGNILNDLFDGKDCSVIAYGQVDSGKSFTIHGDLKNFENRGLIPRFIESIFERNSQLQHIDVKISAVEIHSGKIIDLFNEQEQVKICEDENKYNHIENLSENKVSNNSEAAKLLKKCYKSMRSSRSKVNEFFNKSHTLFIMKITQRLQHKFGELTSSLILADLAGSEHVSKLKFITSPEQKEIRRSLCSLQDVMHALAKKYAHIPYRNSILTRCLQNVLQNESTTNFIICLPQYLVNTSGTKASLQFSERIRGIKRDVKHILWCIPLKASSQESDENESEMLSKQIQTEIVPFEILYDYSVSKLDYEDLIPDFPVNVRECKDQEIQVTSDFDEIIKWNRECKDLKKEIMNNREKIKKLNEENLQQSSMIRKNEDYIDELSELSVSLKAQIEFQRLHLPKIMELEETGLKNQYSVMFGKLVDKIITLGKKIDIEIEAPSHVELLDSCDDNLASVVEYMKKLSSKVQYWRLLSNTEKENENWDELIKQKNRDRQFYLQRFIANCKYADQIRTLNKRIDEKKDNLEILNQYNDHLEERIRDLILSNCRTNQDAPITDGINNEIYGLDERAIMGFITELSKSNSQLQ